MGQRPRSERELERRLSRDVRGEPESAADQECEIPIVVARPFQEFGKLRGVERPPTLLAGNRLCALGDSFRESLALFLLHPLDRIAGCPLFAYLLNFERPIPRRSCLVVPDRFAQRRIARLAHNRDDQPHLRVDAAEPVNAGHPADSEHVRRGPHVHAPLPRETEHIVKAALHDRL